VVRNHKRWPKRDDYGTAEIRPAMLAGRNHKQVNEMSAWEYIMGFLSGD